MAIPEFVKVSTSNDNIRNNIAITKDGQVYTFGKTNHLGQLGRTGKSSKPAKASFSDPDVVNDPQEKPLDSKIEIDAKKVYTGGTKDAGHSVVLDQKGYLWFAGCDRWQQLGLGASINGASGYTWKALWQESFQRNPHLMDLLKSMNPSIDEKDLVRDVAVGGDHTLVLSSNQQDVISFGQGAEGQLGIVTKPFVNSPSLAKELSVKSNEKKISAVCAYRHCSFTLDEDGKVYKRSGKCRLNKDDLLAAIQHCRDHAKNDGLLKGKGSISQ